MRLSIILPVYNVEAYLEKCVRSLQNQDIPQHDFEIIIINDGSTDNSRLIVLQLMQEYNNIVFIEQKNKGVSMARNACIDIAKGKYLLFIDSDDYVAARSFKKILQTADINSADIVFLGFTFLNEDSSEKNKILFEEFAKNLYTGLEAYKLAIATQQVDPDRSVGILFNRDFLINSKIRYTPNVPFLEDGEIMAKILCLAENCCFESTPFYFRTTRPGSATNSNMFFSDKAMNGFLTAAISLKNFSKIQTLNFDQLNHLNQPIAKYTLLAVQACASPKNWEKIFPLRDKIKAKGLINLNEEHLFPPYKFYVKLYNSSIFIFQGYFFINLFIISLRARFKNLFRKNS